MSDGRGNAEGEFAGELSIDRAESSFGFGCKFGDSDCITKKDRALRGEGDAVGGAVEETDAQIVLQGLDLKRDGGLGKKEVLRGFAKVQMFGDGAENFEAEIFELGHGRDYLSSSAENTFFTTKDTKFHEGILGDYFFAWTGDSHTRSEAAGPSDTVPAGVERVRVWS